MSGNKNIYNRAILVWTTVDADFKFKKLIKKDFHHVFLLLDNGLEWMKVSCEYGRSYIELLTVPSKEFPRDIINESTHAIEVTLKPNLRRRISYNIFNHMSCVSFVKLFLGLRIWVHSPYGLYKYLLNMKKTGKYKQSIKDIKFLLNTE